MVAKSRRSFPSYIRPGLTTLNPCWDITRVGSHPNANNKEGLCFSQKFYLEKYGEFLVYLPDKLYSEHLTLCLRQNVNFNQAKNKTSSIVLTHIDIVTSLHKSMLKHFVHAVTNLTPSVTLIWAVFNFTRCLFNKRNGSVDWLWAQQQSCPWLALQKHGDWSRTSRLLMAMNPHNHVAFGAYFWLHSLVTA